MSEVSPDDPRLPKRGLVGLLILSLPILGVLVMFVAYGIMWSLGTAGRGPEGESVVLGFRGCHEAQPLLEARLEDMGIPGSWTKTPDGFEVRATLTGESEVDEAIPQVLSTPARLEIRGGDQVLATNADLKEATVRMDLFMVPYVLLRLRDDAAERVRARAKEDPGGKLWFFVDGEEIGWQSNQNPVGRGDLEINVHQSDEEQRMREVAAWSVTLDHAPLPCAVVPR